MIVNKQQIDTWDSDGNQRKQLVISYINPSGKISYLQWLIPQDQMFEWGYTNRANADKPFYVLDENGKTIIDPATRAPKIAQWKSYDNKFIKKIETTRDLSESRINEIINMFGKQIGDALFMSTAPETWFCDIETDVNEEEGFSSADDAKQPINTISIVHYPNVYVFSRKDLPAKSVENIQARIEKYAPITKDYKFTWKYYPSEREMLDAFLDFLIPIDSLTGWNFLGYDWKYIYNRSQILGLDITRISPTKEFFNFTLNRKQKIDVKIPYHMAIFDYLVIYQMWDKSVKIKENDTLDYVANATLGIKKVEHEWGFEEFYRDHFEDYVFYNAIDSILVEQIDWKIKTASIWQMLAAELRTDLYAAFSTIKPCEIAMTNFLYKDHKVLVRARNQDDTGDASYEGAFVWPTRPGIYKYVGGLDFASLYPSIMRQMQISPEAFLFKDKNYTPKSNEIKTISGAVYRKDPTSVVPNILTYYFGKRKDAKNDRKICDQAYEDLTEIYKKRLAATAV